jgi:hypothetical protein
MSYKGQTSIEYVVSIMLFIFFVVYFLFQMSNLVPEFLSEMEAQRIRSESYQMSEIFVNHPGVPSNWNSLPYSQVTVFGLSNHILNKTNLLSTAKISSLRSICSSLGQQAVRSKLDTDLEFSIIVVNRVNGTVMLDCNAPRNNTRGFSSTVRRTVAFDDGNYGDLTLQVWRP